MQSFAIIGDSNSAKEYLENDVIDKKSNLFIENIQKIAEAREFIQNTSLSLKNPTYYLLENFDRASTETQNALLKTIEEPNNNLYIYLHAENFDRLLPTIQSRVSKVFLDKSDNKDVENSDFFTKSESEMFEDIYSIKKREDAILFINGLNNVNYLENIEETRQRLSQNGSFSLQLTNFVISINN